MKIDRLISIIMILLKEERVSAKALAEKFEVSLRTVYRDMEAVALAGIPVHAVSGTGGGFEIMPQYKIEKGFFTSENLTLLLTGLSSISEIVKADELANALAKIQSIIPASNAAEITFKTKQLSIDLNSWTVNPDISKNLQLIHKSLTESNILKFKYLNLKGKISERKIEPCQLILKNSHWYLYGFCLTKNDFRIFKLSRMWNISLEKEKIIPKEFPPPVLDYTDEIKKIQSEITLKIHSSLLERILDFCPMEKIKKAGPGHFLVEFPFIENDYYFNLLLGFGSRCECISPLEIRGKIAERLESMIRIYKDVSGN